MHVLPFVTSTTMCSSRDSRRVAFGGVFFCLFSSRNLDVREPTNVKNKALHPVRLVYVVAVKALSSSPS